MTPIVSDGGPRFAIVCDSACDVPLSAFTGGGVVMVPLRVESHGDVQRDCLDVSPADFRSAHSTSRGQARALPPAQEDYELAYEGLISQGWGEIVSLHASDALQDSYKVALEAARSAHGARISVIDSKCISGQLGLALAALCRDRAAGLPADEAVARCTEAAEAARMLVLPAQDAHPSQQGLSTGGHHRMFGRAATLSARALGMRQIFQIDARGQVEERFRSSDLSRLAASCAREMSAYAQKVGPLVYVEVVTGVPKIRAAFERPLDTNEFESERAGVLDANPSTTAQLGVGAFGLAYAPASLISVEDVRALIRRNDGR